MSGRRHLLPLTLAVTRGEVPTGDRGNNRGRYSAPTFDVFATGANQYVEIHLSNGEVMEADIPNGHVMWHEEWTHRVENVGTTDIQAIIVESKQ